MGKTPMKRKVVYLDPQYVKNVYRKYGIQEEKVKVFRDFLIQLNHNVMDTYLGPSHLSSLEKVDGHFLWAFRVTARQFYKHGFDFRKNKRLYLQLRIAYMREFYGRAGKPQMDIKKHWQSVMKYQIEDRTQPLLEVQVNLYVIMDHQLF